MKKLLIIGVVLLSGCFATVEYKQLTNQGVDLAKKIAQEGVQAGSQTAQDNLLIHTVHQQKIGSPQNPLPYTTENTQGLAKKVQEQVSFWRKAGIFLGNFVPSGSMISAALSPLGLGWLGSLVTVGLAVWRRKQGQVIAAVNHGKELGMAGVRGVHKINEFIKGMKGKTIGEIEEKLLNSNIIKELAQDAQESEGVRPMIRKLISEFEKGLT